MADTMRALLIVFTMSLVGCEWIVGIQDPDLPAQDAASEDCVPTCDENELLECRQGTPTRVTCDLGCSTQGQPHCTQVAPSNGASLQDLAMVTGGLVLPDGDDAIMVISTDTGEIIGRGEIASFRAATPGGGLDEVTGTYFRVIDDHVSVLAVDSLEMQFKVQVSVEGTRGLIIISRHDVRIGGIVGVNPLAGGAKGGSENGPAGGCAPGGDGGGRSSVNGLGSGGGGGGNGDNGAIGGGDPEGPRGLGGEAKKCGAGAGSLRGGSGGGAGGVRPDGTRGGRGGDGGGAIQITSLTRIELDGIPNHSAGIFANGTGGMSGSTRRGGGGGGAGGTIVLEAPIVEIGSKARLVANGGGGGGANSFLGPQGKGGGGDVQQAEGAGYPEKGHGGLGGALAGRATPGNGLPQEDGGGGGGGVGRIQINGRVIRVSSTKVSPAHSSAPLPTQ